MSDIHPQAIISDTAQLGQNITVGAFSTIGPGVCLGDNVSVASHVVLTGNVTINRDVTVYPFCVIGERAQVNGDVGDDNRITIGRGTILRENCTIHPGTDRGHGLTHVGEDCFLMVGTHIGHDCEVGNRVTMANQTTLGGHVQVGDDVVIGGLTGVHQFVRIGRGAILGGLSGVEHDVIPYGSAFGNRANLQGLNLVGLKRRKAERTEIDAVRRAYRLLFANEGSLRERVGDVRNMFPEAVLVQEILDFMESPSKRQLCVP